MNCAGTLRFNKFSCFVLAFILFLIIYWRSGISGGASPMESDLVNLKSLLKAAIYAAERGGKKVFNFKDAALNVKSKGKTLEGANDPVTDADIASHCAIYYTLKNTFPKLSIVSEEAPKNQAGCSDQEAIDLTSTPPAHGVIDYMVDEHVYIRDVTVWIDPLDATQEYTGFFFNYLVTLSTASLLIGILKVVFIKSIISCKLGIL